MNRNRVALALAIPTVYLACSILVGALLSSKSASSPLTRQYQANNWLAQNYAAMHAERSPHGGADHLDVLDAGPTEIKFLTTEEFLAVVANPACLDKQLRYDNLSPIPEEATNQYCQQQAAAVLKRDDALPLAYTIAVMCDLRIWARPGAYAEAFIFHDPVQCLSTAAKATHWKGYDDLKLACTGESRTVVRQYPEEKEEDLVRGCMVQNLRRWNQRERERCLMRQTSSAQSCS